MTPAVPLIMSSLLAGPTTWPAERAWEWYRAQPWLVGCNYVPSSAANTTEFWSAATFDAVTIDRELGWAQTLGFNVVRVFVQYLVWHDDPAGTERRFDQFLAIANRHHIRVMPVLFDDCSFGDPPVTEPHLGPQREPVPGMILPSWTPSPGLRAVEDRGAWPDLEKYVRAMVGRFGQDPRVVLWDLYNEPGNSGLGDRSLPLVEATFTWARESRPSQPLTMGPWGASAALSQRQIELSDIVSFHCYGNRDGLRSAIERFKRHGRPVVCTEWMARPLGSVWSTDLSLLRDEGVGCLSWGLVNGRTQCQFGWSSKRGAPQPAVWFHDLYHRDGQPYDPAEHTAIRALTHDTALDFAHRDYRQMQTRPGLPAHDDAGIAFGDGWTRWTGSGPLGGALHFCREAGGTARIRFAGTGLALVHKSGPDCGIAGLALDGRDLPPLDTFGPTVAWNQRHRLTGLAPGQHELVVSVTGDKRADATDAYVQLVAAEPLPATRWTTERAAQWSARAGWLVGCNYLPSSAVNDVEMWQAATFDQPTMDRELGWAQGLGFNSLRVFLNYVVWADDPAGFRARFEAFLALAAKHGQSVMPVLFDDCAFAGREPSVGPQPDPVTGVHNSGWVPSPGHGIVADRTRWAGPEAFVKDLVGTHADDPRIVAWDLYNEPGNCAHGDGSEPFLAATFGWARAAAPSQPLTAGPWGGPAGCARTMLALSDVVSFHRYGDVQALRSAIDEFAAQGRPLLCTEWMSRVLGSRWATDLALLREKQVGSYCWGLVAGRTQTYMPWGSKPGDPAPKVWHHDLLRADGTAFDPAEVEAIRRIAGK
ncbi:MAG: cellulase family glycosylhydrolase [Armatimonadetes bacterium]|nr:cellulase family glycosylhydrolase [Armatimonadota bacterium]